MNNSLEGRLIAALGTLAIGWGVACEQSPTSESSKNVVNYSAFTVNVMKTDSHSAFEVYNAILEPPKGQAGAERSTIKFCDSKNPDIVIEVPVSETDYIEKLRARSEDGKLLHQVPYYTARPGSKPCDLVKENGTILKVLAFKR